MSWSVQTISGGDSPVALPSIEDRDIRIAPNLSGSLIASGAGVSNRDRLLAGDTWCVTTGQQPGLFTGPVMTIHKALSAVAIAERLSEVHGRPVVPVFWVAGDDHDFEEINHLNLISSSNEVETIALRMREATASALPIYQELVGEGIRDVLERVKAITPPTEFRDEVLERFQLHYMPEANLSTAFGRLLADLLADAGVVALEPYTPEAKRATVGVMQLAIQQATEINTLLRERGDELERQGQPVPVQVLEEHTMVMMIGSQGRDRILIDGPGFHLRRSGERFERQELLELIEREPERFSPNVLLRPVAEAYLLPTVAYVAGPTERAYWEQMRPLFELMQVRRQTVLPRWSAHVVEQRITKVLEKYQLTMDDFALGDGQLETRLVRDDLPPEVSNTLNGLRENVRSQFSDLVVAATGIEATLEKPVIGAQNQILSQLDHVEKKVLTQLKNRNDVLIRQVSAARTAMFPNHKPQERVVNVLQYLIRHGPGYLPDALTTCREWAANLELPTPVA